MCAHGDESEIQITRPLTDIGQGALHEKVLKDTDCPVCGATSDVRLWKDSRKPCADWTPRAVQLLWEAVVSTVQTHGVAWSAWRPVQERLLAAALPPKLQLESIPKDQLEALPGGVYKWGGYKTDAGMTCLEDAWWVLNQQWQQDRTVRINLLKEADAQPQPAMHAHSGQKHILQQVSSAKAFKGILSTPAGHRWVFREEGTGFQVDVEMVGKELNREYYRLRDAKLYKAMGAEHAKARRKAQKAIREAAMHSDAPNTAGDMTVKGTNKEGKLLYVWGDSDRGRVEVEVTPRALRAALEPGASTYKQAIQREQTPERALRKMKAKLQRIRDKAARGEQERVVARSAPDLAQRPPHGADTEIERYAPALKSLNDPTALGLVRSAYEFLGSASLHYCGNCDEEWPAFAAEWPQSGVPWVGPMAGRCETIERAGWKPSADKPWLCSRCDTSSVYRITYCQENLQHLGPRYPALSGLTWYESLLMARVHPVMSVITLTATGLLCYAGHVCNYYVKVMEWFRGLPAILRDKKWFLIKRRQSIRACAGETQQKKPTTANRRRLEAAMCEARRRMPTVYADSIDLPEELAKFPEEGEQEMLEQEESIDLTGDVKLSREVFCAWVESATRSPKQRPCAAAIRQYAIDQQGFDLRGGVTGETAWELCARLLSLPSDLCKLSSRDIAQLVVYWLEEGHVPVQMQAALYEGMLEDLLSRGKRIETAGDEQLMKCRWLRQLMHGELDAVRLEWESQGAEFPIDLEVEGGLVPGEELPATAEAEREAAALLEDLLGRKSGLEQASAADWTDDWEYHEDDDWGWEGNCEDREIGQEAHAVEDSPRQAGECKPLVQSVQMPLEAGAISSKVSLASGPAVAKSAVQPTQHAPGKSSAAIAVEAGKPLVDPPDFGDRIKDTDREPYWIPGAFPTIFQNETGDPHNYVLKEPDLITWGPHVLRSRGWWAQTHMTFMYWYMNMIQRWQALSAKKWYIRDNPKATGYTVEDLRGMSVKALAKNIVGYTANIPGTKASKAQLRRVIFAMVKQIEIETARLDQNDVAAGDIPCLFGTLTTQRYHWDEIIRIIAEVEGISDYKSLSKGKRRELVNKYPLFVAWYCSVRLELVLKTVVVPIFGASAYVAVYEWSPTGGMVHMHYILWKHGAPRFDLQAESLMARAASLRKAGLVAGGEVTCDIKYVVDFFADYVSEWNPNKTSDGEEKTSYVAERVNEALPHTASLSVDDMLDLLRGENAHERFAYYERAVRTEHLHDFHYPDPLGPPNPSQPCAQLLKGTMNMWYCGSGYPRDLVCQPCEQSVSQDALRPDLWRVNLCRNCQLMNPHMPMATVAMQSNTDDTPVPTRHQAEMYCCKYCSKHSKRKGQASVLYEVLDDMASKDANAQAKFGDDYQESVLGSKIHRAFMAEVGEEMCQAEVAHHANRCPEYLISRPVKHVHFYKKALALNKKKNYQEEEEWGEDAWPEEWGGPEENAQAERRLGTKPSDVELYERRSRYWFWPEGGPISPHLPSKETPEEQVAEASAFDFFRFVKFKGGRRPYLEWDPPDSMPIVIMSPTIRLAEGPDFAFGARWALMQFHPWTDRRRFLDMSDGDVKDYFRTWRSSPQCPRHLAQQYLQENGRRARGGAGPAGKSSKASGHAVAMEPEVYEAKIAELLGVRDYAGAAALQYEQQLASGGAANTPDPDAFSVGLDAEEGSCTEEASSAEEGQDDAAVRDTRVLKMLYKGNMAEVSRQEEQSRKARVYSRRHDFYRHTRCTSVAQEEQSALPAGVINVNEDSEDDGAYLGEQKEIAKEMDELRVAQHWINPEGWDAASEGKAVSKTSGDTIDLRLDWDDVKRQLSKGAEPDCSAAHRSVDEATVLSDYPLDKLDPTQRVFADRVLAWADEVASVYEEVHATGQFKAVPRLRSWLGGSAGSGKSTTLKTCVQHVRLLFQRRKIPAKVELTAYTGVAAFNMGFGARTECSGFQVFPKAGPHLIKH